MEYAYRTTEALPGLKPGSTHVLSAPARPASERLPDCVRLVVTSGFTIRSIFLPAASVPRSVTLLTRAGCSPIWLDDGVRPIAIASCRAATLLPVIPVPASIFPTAHANVPVWCLNDSFFHAGADVP